MINLSAMGNGLHSTFQPLKSKLVKRWCPKWYEAFQDPLLGGFYERLNRNFKPLLTGQRRLVSQCRQLSIYSHLAAHEKLNDYKTLKDLFQFIVEHYHDARTGLWWFSIDDAGNVKDRYADLYALSFVIFSFSHYYRATGDQRATSLARQVLDLIDRDFRMTGLPGLAEAIDEDHKPLPKLRRQNPHMHLLEACLFAYDIWAAPEFLKMADDMTRLFYAHFYDPRSKSVIEFFTDDLKPHPEEGHKIEPGHAFEWVWLLKKHARLHGVIDREDATALQLLLNANAKGWDVEHGGIYDALDPSGNVLADTKRIWPFCEALKANTLMINAAPDRQEIKDRVAEMIAVFNDKYMDDRGFWTEWLSRDLQSSTDYMPATTPYHVYFGIMETADILDERGGSKSISAGLKSGLYGLRRDASAALKKIKASLRR